MKGTPTPPQVEVVYRGAALTLSGVIQQCATHTPIGGSGWQDYFELEAVHCGDQDLTDIIEPGSDAWVELETIANRKQEQAE